ncbi:MAG: hypothetical protein JNK47_02815 [Mesorhizobium sp.]|nr:hypothetical protein [Mesorhizobium sp.]MBL8576132.1 hypothetical protein [Mesorhizobium sp.]
MSESIGGIHVDLGLNQARFQDGLRKAGRSMETFKSRTETQFLGIAKNFGMGLAGGAVAALAPLALVRTALDAINEASKLVDTADRIGITTKALQELSFGFSQAGVEAGDFETGMDQFTKRIGEAATKGNRLGEILKANGVALRDSNGQIRSSESLLGDYADLMKNAASEQERMVLATEAFGRGGGSFTVALKDGKAGLEGMKKAAEEAGGVIDEKLLRRAEEMGDRWDAAWRRFSVNAQSAILTALQGMDDLGSRMDRFLEKRNAAEAGAMLGGMAGQVDDGKGGRPFSNERINSAFLGEVVKADEKLVELLKKRYGDAATKATIIPPGGGGGGGSSSKEDTFKASRDGFREMLGYSYEYEEQQLRINDSIREFGDLAMDAGQSLANALSDGKLEAQELIPILTDVINQLLRAAQAAGGFGSLFSNLFSGGFSPTAGGFASMLGLASGGYTGDGGKYTPAGIVHKGEYVLNQEATRRIGVPRLNAMNRGYANGGFVGDTPLLPRMNSANQGGVVVQNIINNAPAGTTTRTEQQKTPDGTLIRVVTDIVDQHIATGGADKSFSGRYGARPMKTVR